MGKMYFDRNGILLEYKMGSKIRKMSELYFVANHTSMTDIMLMFAAIKDHPFVFVGKKELARIHYLVFSTNGPVFWLIVVMLKVTSCF